MLNIDVTHAIEIAKRSGKWKWQIAEAIGIADTTFSKWLRKELPEDKRNLILVAIEKLLQGAK